MDFNIVKLVDLLNVKKDSDSGSDEEENDRADQEEAVKAAKKPNPYTKTENDGKRNENQDQADNCSKVVDEIVDGIVDEHSELGWEVANNWRKTPEWNVSYKQQVTASDVFLGVC